MRDLVYYVAVTADGYIAAPDGDTSAFPLAPETLTALFARYPETCPAQARKPLDVTAPNRRFDTVVMGYRTYAPSLEVDLPGGVYPHLRQFVVTHREVPVETLDGDLAEQIDALKSEDGADIWLCGGADVAGQLIDSIDEFQFKVYPVLLGDGIPPVAGLDAVTGLLLTASEELPGGVVLNTYRRS